MMTDKERTLKFIELQRKMNLTNREMGQLFGVTKDAVAAWRYGRYPIPSIKLEWLINYCKK